MLNNSHNEFAVISKIEEITGDFTRLNGKLFFLDWLYRIVYNLLFFNWRSCLKHRANWHIP